MHPFTEQQLDFGVKNGAAADILPGAWKFFSFKVPQISSFMGVDLNVVQVCTRCVSRVSAL
jgi:hypothetical protein